MGWPWYIHGLKGDNMSEMSAYEKMFKDGTAFKPIKIDQPSPDNPAGGMGRGADPDEPSPDHSLFDDHMDNMIQEKIAAKKAAVLGDQPVRFTGDLQEQSPQAGDHRITRLEERIKLLEQALSLVMETQTKLMRG